MARYNELHGEVTDLSGIAFTPTHVRKNTLILTCCAVQRPKAQPDGTTLSPLKYKPEASVYKGNLLTHNIW